MHECAAMGCTRSIPKRMLMCGVHWRQVPRDIQRLVWATYRPGQEEDRQPSPAYGDAMRAAIQAVARGKATPC